MTHWAFEPGGGTWLVDEVEAIGLAPLVGVDPAAAVQRGLHDLLSADPELSGVGVYDEPPESAAMPYVVIRDMIATPDDDHSSMGHQVVATLHTWTRAWGNAPGNVIGGRLYALLHQQAPALDAYVVGHTVYIVRREFQQSLSDPQPGVRHRVDRFRIYTYQQEG